MACTPFSANAGKRDVSFSAPRTARKSAAHGAKKERRGVRPAPQEDGRGAEDGLERGGAHGHPRLAALVQAPELQTERAARKQVERRRLKHRRRWR